MFIALVGKTSQPKHCLNSNLSLFVVQPSEQSEADRRKEFVVNGVKGIENMGNDLGGPEADYLVLGREETN